MIISDVAKAFEKNSKSLLDKTPKETRNSIIPQYNKGYM
jgi:hypothetical protein